MLVKRSMRAKKASSCWVAVLSMIGSTVLRKFVLRSETVRDMKGRVCEANGTPIASQELFLASVEEPLADTMTLQSVRAMEGPLKRPEEQLELFLIAADVPHTFSPTLHTKKYSHVMKSPTQLHGDTHGYPFLSEKGCPPGGEMVYRVGVEGSNAVVLGAMRYPPAGTTNLEEWMCNSKDAWCCDLCSRYIFLAGKKVKGGRTAGPDEFTVPCTLDVTVNAKEGTLALAVVGGIDMGVVIRGMPTDAPLHLAVGTYDGSCKVTLLARE